MKVMKWLAPAFALALAASVLFASHVPASLAQQGQANPRNQAKAPGGCYICGTLDYVWVEGADWFGILAEDACPKYLGSNRASPETRRSYCNQVKSKRSVCPQAAGTCDSPNGKYCGDDIPGKGFIYSSGGGVYSDPLSSSPIAKAPTGERLMYTQTTKAINGQTWYYVRVPGTPGYPQVETPAMGWVPGSDVSCVRPTVPLAPRPTQDPSPQLITPKASSGDHACAARG